MPSIFAPLTLGTLTLPNRIPTDPTLPGASEAPRSGERKMVDAVRAAGADVRFTVRPDISHNAWEEAYANP
jgi:2,4-dienoyl-CoA reductase-like NADH-dependent reductase (Old Yellow Enzyme family)